MTELIDIKIKIDNTKYKVISESGLVRSLEIIGNAEIKNQAGATISEIIDSRDLSKKVPIGDLKYLKINFVDFDIPISWAWADKNGDPEIELTLKNIKYDRTQGFKVRVNSLTFGGLNNYDTLILDRDDFETETFTDNNGDEVRNLLTNIELQKTTSNTVFQAFRDIFWKIMKISSEGREGRDEFIALATQLEGWKNSVASTAQHKFYSHTNITNGNKEIKQMIDLFIQFKEKNHKWKGTGVKSMGDIKTAEENGFNIDEPTIKSEIINGKYRGFSVARDEEYEWTTIEKDSDDKDIVSIKISNRYHKENIDLFRKYFPDNLDKEDPKFFRGFSPRRPLLS